MEKSILREKLLNQRNQMDWEVYSEQSRKICAHLEEFFKTLSPFKALHCFLPMTARKEPNLWPLLNGFLKGGELKIYFPVVRKGKLELSWQRLWNVKELKKSPRGLCFGPQTWDCQPDGVDVVVVPALALDPKGFRLGYGGGYYDRLLATPELKGVLRLTPLFSNEIDTPFQQESWDLPVDLAVTSQGLIRF